MHRLRESGAVTTFLGQHDNRVKCVDVAPDESDVAFSGGEDGRVCVWDVREGHRRPAQVMVDLWNGDDFKAQSVRHMAVNPLDGKIVAVAATDSLVRLYDRRMTSADGHTAREDASCVAMYAPVQKCQGEDSETITHVVSHRRLGFDAAAADSLPLCVDCRRGTPEARPSPRITTQHHPSLCTMCGAAACQPRT